MFTALHATREVLKNRIRLVYTSSNIECLLGPKLLTVWQGRQMGDRNSVTRGGVR